MKSISKLFKHLINLLLENIYEIKLQIKNTKSWLVWLSGLSTDLQTKRSLVQFPVRAHAWVLGQIPSWGHVRGN